MRLKIYGMMHMVKLEQIAEAALSDTPLLVRSLVQDWVAEKPCDRDHQRPTTQNPRVLAVAASLAELFAERLGQTPPDWTAGIGALEKPLFLVRAAETMRRTRILCEQEAPEALRKRRIYAPPNYLTFA